MIYIILVLSIISSILYRAGGMSKEQPYWIPVWMRHSWVRDWLCPLCLGILFLPDIIVHFSWMKLLMWLGFYGACGGMLTTYWDWMFGYDNYWFSGFMVGLTAFFLLPWISWWIILARAFFLAITWGGINWICKKYQIPNSDHIEEHTKGFVLG